MASLKIYYQSLVYIVTYSRADVSKFPTKKHFADAIVEAWKSCGISVSHWVASIEGHAQTDDNKEMIMYHYHMALKLEKQGRWLQVRRFLDDTYGMKVHSSDNHNTYYSVYKYVTKEDNNCLHSQTTQICLLLQKQRKHWQLKRGRLEQNMQLGHGKATNGEV
jgi:hypothetical protein